MARVCGRQRADRAAFGTTVAGSQRSEDRVLCQGCRRHARKAGGARRAIREGSRRRVLPVRRQGPGRQSDSIVESLNRARGFMVWLKLGGVWIATGLISAALFLVPIQT